MANRFGRQQKRKMRAALLATDMVNAELKTCIAELENSLSMHHHLLDQQSQKLKKLQDEIDRAKRIIGHNSVLFAPTVLNLGVQEKEPDFVRLPTPMVIHDPNCLSADDWRLENCIERKLMVSTLDVLLSDTVIRQFDFGYHTMVNFDGKRWGYACDQKAIMTMPRIELVELMAKSLAHQIVDDLKKAVAR